MGKNCKAKFGTKRIEMYVRGLINSIYMLSFTIFVEFPGSTLPLLGPRLHLLKKLVDNSLLER